MASNTTKDNSLQSSFCGQYRRQENEVMNQNSLNAVSVESGSILLRASNLDYNINPEEWKRILFVHTQPSLKNKNQITVENFPGKPMDRYAIISVDSIHQARSVISQLDKKKIGYKRIKVNIMLGNLQSTFLQVATILKRFSNLTLPLDQFMQHFRMTYQKSLSLFEIQGLRFKYNVEILPSMEEPRENLIRLSQNSVLHCAQINSERFLMMDTKTCLAHFPSDKRLEAALMDASCLHKICIPLLTFKHQVHKLLKSHNGSIPLLSFIYCYEAEFGKMQREARGASSASNIEEPVFLEHLIACVSDVKISTLSPEDKRIEWQTTKETDSFTRLDEDEPSFSVRHTNTNGSKCYEIVQLSNEIYQVIKSQPDACVSMNSLTALYESKFSKALQFESYGFHSLWEMCTSLSNVLHIMGFKHNYSVTLIHKVQVRRFLKKLIKLLRSQPYISCFMEDLSHLFSTVLNEDLHSSQYGLCTVEDLLLQIPESLIDYQPGSDRPYSPALITLTKPNQSEYEKEMTINFCMELVQLLRHIPHCRLSFKQFKQAYRNYLGKIVELSDYGFNRLSDLIEAAVFVAHLSFEAIGLSTPLKIIQKDDEKIVSLTQKEHYLVLAGRIYSITSSHSEMSVKEFQQLYFNVYKYDLSEHLANLGFNCLNSLLQRFRHFMLVFPAKLDFSNLSVDNTHLCRIDRSRIVLFAQKVLFILLTEPNGIMRLDVFMDRFLVRFNEATDVNLMTTELTSLVMIMKLQYDNGTNCDTLVPRPIVIFARNLNQLMIECNGRIPLIHLKLLYERRFGVPLRAHVFGFPTLDDLLNDVGFVRMEGETNPVLLPNGNFLDTLSRRVAYQVFIPDELFISIFNTEKKDFAEQYNLELPWPCSDQTSLPFQANSNALSNFQEFKTSIDVIEKENANAFFYQSSEQVCSPARNFASNSIDSHMVGAPGQFLSPNTSNSTNPSNYSLPNANWTPSNERSFYEEEAEHRATETTDSFINCSVNSGRVESFNSSTELEMALANVLHYNSGIEKDFIDSVNCIAVNYVKAD